MAAILSGLSVVIMELNRQASSSQKKFQTDMDADFIAKEIAGILADSEACKTIFLGKNPANLSPGIITSISGKYSVGPTFGGSNIAITSYQFSDTASEITDASKERMLIINFATPKIISTTANVIRPRRIKIIYAKSTSAPPAVGTIKSCVSAWVNQQDYWSKSANGNDIFYNSGDVGIGTTGPLYPLHIVKNGGPTLALGQDGLSTGATAGVALFTKGGDVNTLGVAASKGWLIGARSDAYSNTAAQNDFFISKSDGFNNWNKIFNIDFPTGNVGIGTTSTPAFKLDVDGTASFAGENANLDGKDLSSLSGTGKLLIGWNKTAGKGEIDFIANDKVAINGSNGQYTGGFYFYDYKGGTLTPMMSIQTEMNRNGARVGIGTMKPMEALQIEDEYGGKLALASQGGAHRYILGMYNTPGGGTYGLGSFHISDNLDSTRLAIESDGHVNIPKGLKVGDKTAVDNVISTYGFQKGSIISAPGTAGYGIAIGGTANNAATGLGISSGTTPLGAFFYDAGSTQTIVSSFAYPLVLSSDHKLIYLGNGTVGAMAIHDTGALQLRSDTTELVLNSSGSTFAGNLGIIGNISSVTDITGTGKITMGSFEWTSDRRLKENIQPIEDSTEKILKLRPVKYQWKKNHKKDYGFIAQEVAEVIPEITSRDSQKIMHIDYAKIIPFLVDQIQRQQKEIEILKRKVK